MTADCRRLHTRLHPALHLAQGVGVHKEGEWVENPVLSYLATTLKLENNHVLLDNFIEII